MDEIENCACGFQHSNDKPETRFPVGLCKACGKPIDDPRADGTAIVYCSYECYCLD